MRQIPFLAEGLLAAAYCFGYALTAGWFCYRHLEKSGRNALLFMGCLFGARMFMSFIHLCFPVPYIVFVLTNHILLTGLVLLLFRAEAEKKLLVALLLITITTLTGNFCESFLSFLVLVWLHIVEAVPKPFFSDLGIYFIGFVGFAVELLSVYWMSGRLTAVLHGKPGKWFVMSAVPLIAVILITDVAVWGASNGVVVRSGGTMGLYYDQLFSHAEICVLTALSIFAAGFYVFGMDRMYRERRKSNQYCAQIAAYQMFKEQYEQAERLRHDMKNHVIALSGLLRNREWEKMDAYLRTMADSGSILPDEETSGNKAVDALLYQKRKLAREKHIKWECDVQVPKECGINEFDFCVLFGNILDNALKACERIQSGEQRLINVQSGIIKKCFLLESKNSINAGEGREALAVKQEKTKTQGIGLLNIKDVVQKYQGTMNIEVKEREFVISVLLPINTDAYDIETAI